MLFVPLFVFCCLSMVFFATFWWDVRRVSNSSGKCSTSSFDIDYIHISSTNITLRLPILKPLLPQILLIIRIHMLNPILPQRSRVSQVFRDV